MSKQKQSRSNLRQTNFQICLESAKDYLAHKKFTKKSGLRYEGEVARRAFPKGPDGWIQWRRQFAPRQGEDTTPVENELNGLHGQRRLSDDEYARLRGLYGLDLQGATQAFDSTIRPRSQPEMAQPLQVPSISSPSAGFCMECGAQIMPGKRFCVKCRASAPPSMRPQPQQTVTGVTTQPLPSPPQTYPPTQPPSAQPSAKSGGLGAILNFFFPGVGYWYLGYRKVVGLHPILFLIVIWVVEAILGFLSLFLTSISLLICIFLAYDAYVKAQGKPGWIKAERERPGP